LQQPLPKPEQESLQPQEWSEELYLTCVISRLVFATNDNTIDLREPFPSSFAQNQSKQERKGCKSFHKRLEHHFLEAKPETKAK
jgi:hypothetical protein